MRFVINHHDLACVLDVVVDAPLLHIQYREFRFPRKGNRGHNFARFCFKDRCGLTTPVEGVNLLHIRNVENGIGIGSGIHL